MYFQNPDALWAFLLLVIPIIVHLFNFRRLKKVYFSNLSFLRTVDLQQKSKSTIKKLLVLTSRLLALAFLVLAFAQPAFIDDQAFAATESLGVYMDNSLSMQQSEASGEPVLYTAYSSFNNMITESRATELRVFNNDGSNVVSLRGKDFEGMDDIRFSPFSPDFEELISRMDFYRFDQVHVFSDLQHSTFWPLPDQITRDTARRVVFHMVKPASGKNLYIDTAYLVRPLTMNGENRLDFNLKNTGKDRVDNVLVKVEKDGQQLSSFSTEVDGLAQKKLSVDLGVTSSASGDYQITIQDNPVVFDNQFFFSIADPVKSDVVILSEGNGNQYLKKVFANEDYFDLVWSNVDNASFQEITNADLLILDGLNEVPAWLSSQFDQVTGNVLVVPPAEMNTASFLPLLGFTISSALKPTAPFGMATLEHPFFMGMFNEKDERANMPEVKVGYDVSGFHEPIIKTGSGDVVLTKSGSRNVFFLSAPLIDSSTNFHKHALFVPVMYQLSQPDNVVPLYYRMDQEVISLNGDRVASGDILELRSGVEVFIPSYHKVKNKLLLQIPDVVSDPGVYQLTSKSDTIGQIALNYSKKESEVAPVDLEEFKKVIAGYDHLSLEEIDESEIQLAAQSDDFSQDGLWKYALLLTLIFLMTETLLLRFFR